MGGMDPVHIHIASVRYLSGKFGGRQCDSQICQICQWNKFAQLQQHCGEHCGESGENKQ